MKSLPSARDYYYSAIAPNEAGKSYQHAHHLEKPPISDADEWIKIAGHQPQRSNDILIEEYMAELIATTTGDIKQRLLNTFVAKKRDFTANAGAVHAKGHFTGDLVFFNVGLSDACFQYAIVFVEFLEVIRLRQENGDDSPATKRAMFRLCESITKIAEAQMSWAIAGNIVRLKPENLIFPKDNVVGQAVDLACCMDKSILRHELVHHFLGHTGDAGARVPKLAMVVEECLASCGVAPEHNAEYEADVGSVLMSSVGVTPSPDTCYTIAFGSLLMLTVMGQLTADIHAAGVTHPSNANRFLLMRSVLRTRLHSEFYESIESDVQRFQALLFKVQGRGLGQLHTEL